MSRPIWFDLDDALLQQLRELRGKTIRAKAVLPAGLVLEGIGEIWVRVNGAQTQGAVTVAFDHMTEPYVMAHTEIHLVREQLASIAASQGDADCEFIGDLVPNKIERMTSPHADYP